MKKEITFNLLLIISLIFASTAFPTVLVQANIAPGEQLAPQSMLIWTEHIAHKIQPTTVPSSTNSIQLEGARDSNESAQIIVRASGESLAGVNMSVSALSDDRGHSIPADNVIFYRQYFIDFTGVSESEPGNMPVPENSPTGDPWLPDALIPFVDPYLGNPAGAPFDVAANRNQPVWVDFYIPADTTPGVYSGQITVSANGEPNVTVPVTLTVWDLVLPDQTTVLAYFNSHFGELINYHRDTYACGGSSCWLDDSPYAREMVRRYEELAHNHRIDPGQFYVYPPGGCTPPDAGEWAAYDAALQPYLDGSYWSDGVPSSWIDTPFTPGANWGIQTSCSQAEYTALAQAWANHLKAKGWFEQAVVYALDEPDSEYYDEIASHSSWMQTGDPDWKAQIMDTVTPRPGNVATLNPALGIYCTCLRCYDNWTQQDYFGRDEWPSLFTQGIQHWFYESNAQSDPYPTFAINTLLGVEPRIVMWGSWYENATGFLYWDTTAWDDDLATGGPWGPNVDYGKSGDGVLIYPGHHDGLDAPMGSPVEVTIDGPIPSYRLKVIRAGLQDWTLFKLAEEMGEGAYARSEVARVYGQFGRCDWSGCPPPENGSFLWLTDAALMDEIRHNIAMRLSTNDAPDQPSNPNPADGATDVFTNPIIFWQGGDPDGDPITYTVALGVTNPPPITATVTASFYAPSLAVDTAYYWQIAASDGISTTLGAVWQFTTGALEARRIYLPLVGK